MKPFHFSLDTLLSVREIEEKREMNALGELLHEKNQLLARKQQLEQRRDFLVRELKEESDMGKSFLLQKDLYYLNSMIDREIRMRQPSLDSVEKKISAQQKLLLDASSRKKVVERLKEKAWDRYIYEFNREESRLNDEVNQNLWQWRQSEENHPESREEDKIHKDSQKYGLPHIEELDEDL